MPGSSTTLSSLTCSRLGIPPVHLDIAATLVACLKSSDVPVSVGDDSYVTWLLTASLSSPCLTAWKRTKTSLKQNPKPGSYAMLA